MAFERVIKKSGMMGIDDDKISFNSYGMTLGDNASKMITTEFVEIYLDVEGRRVGFKPTKDSSRGYKLASSKQTPSKKCVSGNWATRISNGIFSFDVDGDMIVIRGVEIAPKKKLKEFPKEIQLPKEDGVLREL